MRVMQASRPHNLFKKRGGKNARLLVAAILLAMTAMTAMPGAASASVYYSPHQLVATSNGQCLTFNTDLSNVSQRLYTSRCALNWSPQLWDISSVGDGYYNIRSRYDSTRCVDVFAYNTDVGARVVTWTCIPGATNQQWSFTYSSATGAWAIQARHSSRCLESVWPWVDQNYCYWLVQPRWYVTNGPP